MIMTLLNCRECIGGRHDKCTSPENCLCANDRHGNNIKNGVKINYIQDNEPRFYENCMKDSERLDNLMDNEVTDITDRTKMIEIASLLITSGHVVSQIEIKRIISEWCRRYGVKESIDDVLDIVWNNHDVFQFLKNICFELGKSGKNVMFAQGQLIEVSYYLMGRYHIKRVELTGNLLFWNEQYYESNAEQLIRRRAREILIKSKNGDMNEIVRMIEDTCRLITWSDIENSIHMKCLLNGTYNIKTGEFVDSFSPDDIILHQIPHNYDISQEWNDIQNKVKEIISNGTDEESYYDSLSVALHPYTGIDFQFGGIGPPGTGKSQLCELSIMVLGDENVSASPIHLIANDLTTQKDVAFKFLNIDMDMSNESIKNIDVLKRWITQDKFTARGIYEHNTTFRPMARMCFMANDLYEIANVDDAEAMYERTHIIKLENKFRGSDGQVKNLFQKTATESQLSGFITYLLRNATDIYNNQRIRHPINIQTVKEIWNLHGNRIREFSETYLEKGVSYRVDQNEVWNRWLTFANRKNYPAKDKKKFQSIFDEIVGNSPTKTSMGSGEDRKQVYAYSGFRLWTDEEMEKNNPLFSSKSENKNRAFCAQSSKSYILSLLNITRDTPNQNKIEEKIMELLELADYSRGKQD